VFYTESFDYTSVPFTFGYSDYIDHLILVYNLVNFNFFFEKSVGEFYFISNGSSVNLDFVDVIFFLS